MEAQVEAVTLMLSIHNIFLPSDGSPVMAPSQDIVLGCYYLSSVLAGLPGEGKAFSGLQEPLTALGAGKIAMHAKIRVRLREEHQAIDEDGAVALGAGRILETTAGRILFNDLLPEGVPFYNLTLTSKQISFVIHDVHRRCGHAATVRILDEIKDLGFKAATRAGLSFGIQDLRRPPEKAAIVAKAQGDVDQIEKSFERGVITEGERYNQIIDCWTHARERVWTQVMQELKNDVRRGSLYVNPIYLMVTSGARGGIQQIGQLAGMRGLMAKPSGRIIENPIRANFREGLSVLEYFSSTHGSRKGLADTALKTAESGYLTRKMADVAQNMVIVERDCGTPNGIRKETIYRGDKVDVPLALRIRGRVTRERVVDPRTKAVVVKENDLIDSEKGRQIEALGRTYLHVRSPLTCESRTGVCALCYGMDLSSGELVEEGLAVGIIAAQSIGEPGTQLTMRTFHIGGTASRTVEESEVKTRQEGVLRFHNLSVVTNEAKQDIVLNRNGEIEVQDADGKEIDRYPIKIGAVLRAKDGQKVSSGAILARWDPHMIPIISEKSGKVRFKDIEEGVTMREEVDARTGRKRRVIVEHKGDQHPEILIEDSTGDILGVYSIPEKAHLEVEGGQKIRGGDLLAKTPREISGTQDITGGLPRVTELLEARKPKDPSIISKIDGVVEFGDPKRGKRTILVKNDAGMEEEHLVPHGKHLMVHRGDRVKAGDRLVDGPLELHDILAIKGAEEVQRYILGEVQAVYRAQNVRVDDKHVEVILSRMMARVRVEDPGETDFLPGSVVQRGRFNEANQAVQSVKKKPATSVPLLLGITKAALFSDSFLSAASFQDTTKVLTEAALYSKIDLLLGLKENVILGHMIPAGTGFRRHHESQVRFNV
ncbi:MAG: DNA-directed RNA polymerase subunit beta', partial [Planctomycetes bacterium]|nr:DNA-directed RNA polymerase subunit beta' [Planctomycetota bacterium]